MTGSTIIGMGCFFPKSSGLKDYWRLIFHGEDAISERIHDAPVDAGRESEVVRVDDDPAGRNSHVSDPARR